MTISQDWLDAIGDVVYSLFGAKGQLLFQEHTGLILIALLGGAALLGAVLLRLVLGRARRTWREVAGDLPLLRSRHGRRVLGLAREIRRGSRRLRRVLLTMESEPGEHRGLAQLLEKFTQRELPQALARAHSFIETGGERLASSLEKGLARQEAAWAGAPDGEGRKKMEQEIAETRQRLLQARQSNAQRARLLQGLEEAALALRTLELEAASLGAARSRALDDLRDHLNDVAEGLQAQRQVHAEFQERP